jgi:hypothetical protein
MRNENLDYFALISKQNCPEGTAGTQLRCPCEYDRSVFFGAAKRLHHSFEDPAALNGSEEERLAMFSRVRDQLCAYLTDCAQKEVASKL